MNKVCIVIKLMLFGGGIIVVVFSVVKSDNWVGNMCL